MRSRFNAVLCLPLIAFAWTPAIAAERCLTNRDYTQLGGRLSYIDKISLNNLPYNFTCDFVPWFGVVEFKGLIDERGAIHDLEVVKNSWEDRPDYHARILSARLNAARYVAPMARGKRVCVERNWRIGLSRRGEVIQ